MKNITTIVVVLMILSGVFCFKLIHNYEQIDAYNQAASSFQWVSRQGDGTTHVSRMGNEEDYYIGVYTTDGAGIMDRNGNEILPCQYDTVEYNGGGYMAAATTSNWVLFDTKGQQITSFNRISLPYSYAGDRYFLQYGDDYLEDPSDGFAILDVVSGEVVQEYADYYNAVRLDDGNWYISKTPDVDGIAARMVFDQWGGYTVKQPEEDAKAAPCGFFTDENFVPLFDGKEYRLICQGGGRYVAEVVESSASDIIHDNGQESILESDAQPVVVALDETGELLQITDEALLEQIEKYAETGIWTTKPSKDCAAFCQKLSKGFSEIVPLPGTKHFLVNGDLGCGIVRPRAE